MHAKIITQIKRHVFIALVTPMGEERAQGALDKSIPIRRGSARQAGGLCLCAVLQPGLFQNVSISHSPFLKAHADAPAR